MQIEISDADGQLSLGHGNVDTISGAEFRQGKPIMTRIGVDFSGQLFGIDKKGRNFRVEVNIRGRYRAVGSAVWSEFFVLYRSTHTHYWSRGFYTKGVWQQVETGPTNPRAYQEGQDGGGAFSHLGSGIAAQVLRQLPTQWRYIPFGTYTSPARYRDVTAASITLGGSSRDTFRQSWYRDVPEGQYEVELTRLTKDHDGSNTTFSRLNWTQMRSHQPDTVDYTGRKRMALRGRASGQFQGAIQTVNAIARARIAYEDASRVMRYGYSDNPAWLFVHFAQGQYIHDRLVYGGGLATPERVMSHCVEVDSSPSDFAPAGQPDISASYGEDCAAVRMIAEVSILRRPTQQSFLKQLKQEYEHAQKIREQDGDDDQNGRVYYVLVINGSDIGGDATLQSVYQQFLEENEIGKDSKVRVLPLSTSDFITIMREMLLSDSDRFSSDIMAEVMGSLMEKLNPADQDKNVSTEPEWMVKHWLCFDNDVPNRYGCIGWIADLLKEEIPQVSLAISLNKVTYVATDTITGSGHHDARAHARLV